MARLEVKEQIEAAKQLAEKTIQTLSEYQSQEKRLDTPAKQLQKNNNVEFLQAEEELDNGSLFGATEKPTCAESSGDGTPFNISVEDAGKTEWGQSLQASGEPQKHYSVEGEIHQGRDENGEIFPTITQSDTGEAREKTRGDRISTIEQEDDASDEREIEHSPSVSYEKESAPFSISDKQFSSFSESVADLKNPDKDCSCTPDSFLAEVTAIARDFHRNIEWFRSSYYETVFPDLNVTQMSFLKEQVEAICDTAKNLYDTVERTNLNGEQKEAQQAKC